MGLPGNSSLPSSLPSSLHTRPKDRLTLRTTPSQLHSTKINTPKLGDFSTLDISPGHSRPEQPPAVDTRAQHPGSNGTGSSDDTNSEGRLALGNFSRIFPLLGRPQVPLSLTTSPGPRKDTFRMPFMEETPSAIGNGRNEPPKPLGFDNTSRISEEVGKLDCGEEGHHEIDSESTSDVESVLSYSTPETSLSDSSSRDGFNPKLENPVLFYQLQQNGAAFQVPAISLPSIFIDSSYDKLKAIFDEDNAIQHKSPEVHENGVHVFLDASNIFISYLQTLKAKLNIPLSARFAPNPLFNIETLTDLIVRDRNVKTLRAGCSIFPDRNEPFFIKELRQLDYKVDVRERRPTQEPKACLKSGFSQEAYSPNTVRYVEDLVDETLQTRIGETFMSDPEKRGTLILVTGDAQPAKYSDGFYKYATRALKWGWHVEVVCWRICCSSLWKELAADGSVGNRFRLIELDSFLDHLWLKKD